MTLGAIPGEPPTFKHLYPVGPPVTAPQLVDELANAAAAVEQTAARPRVLLNMVSTLDGRASLGGRSAPLSGDADRALFHGLRSFVDGVLVGARTVREERYGPIVRDPEVRRARLQRGLPEQPLACVVSASLALDPALPLLADPSSRVVVLTGSERTLSPSAARVEYVRARRGPLLDLPGAIAELGQRFQVRTLLCEGGPHLAGELVAADLLDELFLSLAPTLAGDPPGGEPALRILSGAQLEPARKLELGWVLEADSTLFLRYRITAPVRR